MSIIIIVLSGAGVVIDTWLRADQSGQSNWTAAQRNILDFLFTLVQFLIRSKDDD
jgi:hypothetical protein